MAFSYVVLALLFVSAAFAAPPPLTNTVRPIRDVQSNSKTITDVLTAGRVQLNQCHFSRCDADDDCSAGCYCRNGINDPTEGIPPEWGYCYELP